MYANNRGIGFYRPKSLLDQDGFERGRQDGMRPIDSLVPPGRRRAGGSCLLERKRFGINRLWLAPRMVQLPRWDKTMGKRPITGPRREPGLTSHKLFLI
jgi:hypothetical protein